MAKKVTTPTFAASRELARYVKEENRLRGGRPAIATFLPTKDEMESLKGHLSVNSAEVESLSAIADYHRALWQGDEGKVALCSHKVFDYNEAARKVGVQLSYDQSQTKWRFQKSSTPEDAYKHRPREGEDIQHPSPSHSGVEFSRALTEHTAARFARLMATKKKFHWY